MSTPGHRMHGPPVNSGTMCATVGDQIVIHSAPRRARSVRVVRPVLEDPHRGADGVSFLVELDGAAEPVVVDVITGVDEPLAGREAAALHATSGDVL